MYSCDFSRSDGAGRATTRNTRGLTRSVMALIVPPLPAASRPSKITTTRSPFSLTQSCNAHSSTCSLRSAFSYSLRVIGLPRSWLSMRIGDHGGRPVTGGHSQRFGHTPCVVEGAVGPYERLQSGAGRRRRRALQGDIFQQRRAPGLAFGAKLFRGVGDRFEDGLIRRRLGSLRGL